MGDRHRPPPAAQYETQEGRSAPFTSSRSTTPAGAEQGQAKVTKISRTGNGNGNGQALADDEASGDWPAEPPL